MTTDSDVSALSEVNPLKSGAFSLNANNRILLCGKWKHKRWFDCNQCRTSFCTETTVLTCCIRSINTILKQSYCILTLFDHEGKSLNRNVSINTFYMHYQCKLLFLAAFKIHNYYIQVTNKVMTDNLYILNKECHLCAFQWHHH